MKRLLTPVLGFFLLVACSGTTNLANIIADAKLIIGTPVASDVCPGAPCGLTGAYLALKQLYPNAVSPAADAQVQTLLASATMTGGLLDQLKSAATAADQAADLRGIESVANQVLGIVASQISKMPNVDPGIVLDFQAASILLPFLEQAANQLVPAKTAGVVRVPAIFGNAAMTADQARKALRR